MVDIQYASIALSSLLYVALNVWIIFAAPHKHDDVDKRLSDYNAGVWSENKVWYPADGDSNIYKDFPAAEKSSRCGQSPIGKGQPKRKRIIGGIDAQPRQFPWLVRLYLKGSSWTICSGVLITPYFILTAAHCFGSANNVKYKFDRMEAYLGDHNRGKTDEGNEQMIEFDDDNVIIHEHFQTHWEQVSVYQWSSYFLNDIALIKLNAAVKMDQSDGSIGIMCLPGESEIRYMESQCEVAGWGQWNKDDEEDYPHVLQYTKVKVKNETDSSCALKENQIDMTICGFGGSERDSCGGDSGGPLMCKSRDQSQTIVLGLVSAGPEKCAHERDAGKYTNVFYFRGWIAEEIRKAKHWH